MGVVAICASTWETSTGPCTITPAMARDSGEYWCEAGEGKRSSTVNITVTGRFTMLHILYIPKNTQYNEKNYILKALKLIIPYLYMQITFLNQWRSRFIDHLI